MAGLAMSVLRKKVGPMLTLISIFVVLRFYVALLINVLLQVLKIDSFLPRALRDLVIYSMLRVKDYGLARELWIVWRKTKQHLQRRRVNLVKVLRLIDRCNWSNSDRVPSAGTFAGYYAWFKGR